MKRVIAERWLGVGSILLLLFSCSREPAPPPVPAPEVRFADVTAESGLTRAIPTYDAAIGDFNADGWLDIYVGNHEYEAALLRNDGRGGFEDRIATSGMEPRGDKHGVAWTDYDNDGLLDLFVTLGAFRGQGEKANPLYRNLGGAHFEAAGSKAGVDDPRGRSRAAASLDYDGDGLLDLLVTNFATPSRLFRNRGDGSFEDVSEKTGILATSSGHVTWADFDADGDPDLLLGEGPQGLRLLRNDDGHFVDATEAAGLDPWIDAGGAAFGDYDNDGILDLYVSRGWSYVANVHAHDDGTISFALFGETSPRGFDFESESDTVHAELHQKGSPAPPEQLLCGEQTRPSGHAFDCGGETAIARGTPSIDPGYAIWRDPEPRRECDTCPPIYSWHLRWTGTGDWNETGIVRGGVRPELVGLSPNPPRGGALYRGTGNGEFERVYPEGLEPDVNGQGAAWLDVNNDGWLDLYVVDTAADGVPSKSQLFLNDGKGGFARVPDDVGATPSITSGRPASVHAADFDRDGRVDLFLTNGWGAPPFNRGPYVLLRNLSAPRHWLEIDLVGNSSNRPGLGAWLELEACGRKQVRYMNGERSDLSQSIVGPHFGLGDCARIDRLVVRWPSGRRSELRDVAADQVLKVEEPLPPDVVMIVVDTLRGKSLSLLGYDRETSPNLAEFARDAVNYADAISPGTWTVPAHGSLFTGLLPSYHGAERVASSSVLATPLNPEVETLAEILGRRGYKTGAFVANKTYLTPSLGFARGFDTYVPNDDHADEVAPVAVDWLAEQPRPAFLFLNVLEPHEPYAPPSPYDSRFPGKLEGFGEKITDIYWAGKPITEEMKEHFRSQYDGEIAYVDDALAGVFERLRAMGRYDEALIIVTSDHGEILGEHGLAGHGVAPFEELLHVPLFVKLPGNKDGGSRVARRVSTLGVFATILAAAGIALPEGVQAVPVDQPHRVWAEDVSFTGDRVIVGYEGDQKLVHTVKPDATAQQSQLYDLASDPKEQHPGDPDDAPDLAQAVETFRTAPRPKNEAPPPVIDPERERQLRDLGYLR